MLEGRAGRPLGGARAHGILADGSLWDWGSNYAYQLDYAWGTSTFGQAGTGDVTITVPRTVVAAGAALISATANNVVISVPGHP